MKTIGIIGLGVMGGSFASRLHELGYKIIGYDKDPEVIQYALDHGLIDEGTPYPEESLLECDTLILCLYPSVIPQWIEENQQYIHPGTVIMEISGVKTGIIESIRRHLRQDVELVSIHPMCGRESRGISYASASIFTNANFIIIPHPSNQPDTLRDVEFLARMLGCRRVSSLSPQAHDEMIAFLSQLTHIIAVSLMNTHENEHLVEYTGDSFRDLTRIARINEDMWSELFIENKNLLLSEIDQFDAALHTFRQALEAEDTELMKEMMKKSTQRRQKFD